MVSGLAQLQPEQRQPNTRLLADTDRHYHQQVTALRKAAEPIPLLERGGRTGRMVYGCPELRILFLDISR